MNSFLHERQSLAALSRCLDPPTPPTSQTKSDFETRTAAINVTPADSSTYDINQIKEDAIWLSQQGKVDEVSALRLVVIEWQERPAERILRGYPEEEVISLQQASGTRTTNFGSSTFSYNKPQTLSTLAATSAQSEDSSAPGIRRARLLHLLLAEQESLLGVSVILEACYSLEKPSIPGEDHDVDQQRLDWVSELGAKVSEIRTQQRSSVSEATHDPVLQTIQAMRRQMKILEDSEAGSMTISSLPGGENEFTENQICTLIRLMQFMFVQVHGSARNCTAAATRTWFQFMDEQGFFQSFDLVRSMSNATC